MLDKNGKEIRTGDVVRISGAYFKNDNGTYFVTSSPGDPTWCGRDHSMTKICRNGRISTAKYNICFWPIGAFVTDRAKRAAANVHNREHATIEVINTIDRTHVIEHFETEAKDLDRMAERQRWDYGENSEIYKKTCAQRDFYKAVVARIKEETK